MTPPTALATRTRLYSVLVRCRTRRQYGLEADDRRGRKQSSTALVP